MAGSARSTPAREARPEREARVLTREELLAWGEAFGRGVPPSTVLAIAGELGAGKTTLVQAICRGYGVHDEVTSPTFALVHEYQGARGPVYHLDLYRLTDPSQLTNLAWDEVINSSALVLVEWPERAGSRLPGDVVRVNLAHVPGDDDHRVLEHGA